MHLPFVSRAEAWLYIRTEITVQSHINNFVADFYKYTKRDNLQDDHITTSAAKLLTLFRLLFGLDLKIKHTKQ